MLDFGENGWLEGYRALFSRYDAPYDPIRNQPKMASLPLSDKDSLLPIYNYLQPTGILYGFPVELAQHWQKEQPEFQAPIYRSKFIVLDAIFAILAYKKNIKHGSRADLDRLNLILKEYFLYEESVAYHLPSSDLFFEDKFLNKIETDEETSGRTSFGISSLIFWDFYFLLRFAGAYPDDDKERTKLIRKLHNEAEEMKVLTLQYMISACFADDILEKEEQTLLSQFIYSAGLEKKSLRKVKRAYRKQVKLKDLPDKKLSWLGKRYFLDLCNLAVLANMKITESEDVFIHDLVKKLELPEEEIIESRASLGTFLVRQLEHIPFLQGKINPVHLIADVMQRKSREVFGAIKAESIETKDMTITFGKLLAEKLNIGKRKDTPSEEEIKAAINQLKDIPRFAPFFAVFMIPLPGMVESWLLLAMGVEKLSRRKIKLLPDHFGRIVHKEKEEVLFTLDDLVQEQEKEPVEDL